VITARDRKQILFAKNSSEYRHMEGGGLKLLKKTSVLSRIAVIKTIFVISIYCSQLLL